MWFFFHPEGPWGTFDYEKGSESLNSLGTTDLNDRDTKLINLGRS